MKKDKYSKEKIEEVVLTSLSINQCLQKLNLITAGGNYQTLNKYIKLYGIDISHFTGMGWNVGLKFKPNPPKSLKNILVNPSHYQSHKLRLRLIEEGYKTHCCENCNNSEWLNLPIPLEIHHIDGNNTNNCIENLQILCPNCHALTDNYRGKNKRVAHNENYGAEPIKVGEDLYSDIYVNTEPSPENY
jgi:hypothetical protein